MTQRNILIITLGQAPALVTETVWALLQRRDRLEPDEIHLVTTLWAANSSATCS